MQAEPTISESWRRRPGPMGLAHESERFYAEVNGVGYHGYDSGGSGQTMLFLHGWPDDSSLWRHQYAAASGAGYRAIALDWIGHGASERVTDFARYDRTLLSSDLAALGDRFNWGRVHCVAHDYGAVVGWQYCTIHPDLVRSYCALSVGHPVAIVKYPTIANSIKSWFLIYNSLPFAVRGYKARNAAFFRWAMRQHPDQAQVVALLQSDDAPAYIRAWELGNPIGPLLRESLTKSVSQFSKLRAPTRGIWGSKDCYADAVPMQKSAQLVDNAFDYVRLEGLGHWLQLEAPDIVTPLIIDWATQHGGAGA
ncbi:hypothetical protein BBF93_14325 [Hyphomonas sp. CACIAM 19H1]|uniref:alpha/beta fold hydrolase n=1 Tax=Hyphomonas sp. CACIAM 19H1 TaxID=1873716 RepID=UPI000DED4CC2|nr:alpha/beta hydrolase [Hyphomonas sp. CACIAM 19H1]AXE65259.1 hypothetical protein BBF93_14325 [Hyphomonas sp. CACIAM 19H1]